tara:strand:- start:612 stop:1586 length:975 start_codon:yes stop_codon:yes gene_type:complete
MAPLRSLGNINSAFDDFYARTGKDAVGVAPLAKATGGDVVFAESGYVYHVYTTTGASTFVVTDGPITAQYLVVGGGGSAGSPGGGGGGGGGAGGLLNSTVPLANNPYPVVVGAGGSFIDASDVSSGLDSKFNTAVAAGGGRGGHYNPILASYRGAHSGASGGGAEAKDRDTGAGAGNVYSPASPLHPAPAPGQGNAGGSSPTPNNPGNNTGGGGGGGAGGAGGDVSAPTPKAGDGGNGLAVPWIPPAYGTPGPDASLRYFAGGGGGGGQALDGGNGGYGGGGDGGTQYLPANDGTANTGGGAGAGKPGTGANGGSGIVIVRYQV